MAAKPRKVATVPPVAEESSLAPAAGEGAAAYAPSPESPVTRSCRSPAAGGRRRGIEALADRALKLLAEAGRPLAPRELAEAIGLEPRSWRLRQAVTGLVGSGLVAVVGRGRSTAYALTEREGYEANDQTAPAGEQPSLSEASAGAEGAADLESGETPRPSAPPAPPPPLKCRPPGTSGLPPARQDLQGAALIEAFLRDKGATRCPTAYVAPVEGAERVAEPVPAYVPSEEDREKARRRAISAARRAAVGGRQGGRKTAAASPIEG